MSAELASGQDLLEAFSRLRKTVSEQSKIIIHVFPEYTPHDATRHLEQLFQLADKVLGPDLYDRVNAAELSLLAFALYSHDWGMAVGNREREAVSGLGPARNLVLIPDEQRKFRLFREEALRVGKSDSEIWEDYLRDTHASRSGYRLREELKPLGQSFAEMAARVAEGHVLDFREIRDPDRYQVHTAILGQDVNVAAVATYVRLVDLLDLAEDRTPFALWSIVAPQNAISRIEWSKHRALAPIAVSEYSGIRQVLIAGVTDDPAVYAALADLRAWVDAQFGEAVGFLRTTGGRYDPRLDSAIRWDIKPTGFEPVLLRFDFDRSAALGLLSTELYGSKQLTFVRELLQNSVDAIDTRVELLRQHDTTLEGRISINIATLADLTRIEWTDNGIGMDRYTLDNYFTKIGRSWYQSPDFRRHLLTHDPVSKFGVGVLSCFAISPTLTVVTKREPLLARDPHGWHVYAPARDSHFSVKVDDQIAVGTTVVLEIPRHLTGITATAIGTTIQKTAALVSYKILLNVDGLIEVIDPVTRESDPRLPFVHVSSLDDSALTELRLLTVQFNHHYRSPTGDYEAFFSCQLPRDLASITDLKHDKWVLASKRIDFDDFIIDQPNKLFVKGVASDGKGDRGRSVNSLALNILKPSLVRADLARARSELTLDVNLQDFWADVARRIRGIIGPHSPSIGHRLQALSVASRIGDIPREALSQVVPPDQWPVWVLEAGSGATWHDVSSVLVADEILEAPNELRYALGQNPEPELSHIKHWAGPRCFVTVAPYSDPWWGVATTLIETVLEGAGFVPIDLRAFNSAAGDDVPLFCEVWRKQPRYSRPACNLDLADMLREWRTDPMLESPALVQRALARHSSDSAPSLVRFPDNMHHVAAIGSLYWNQNNAKIRALVEVLLELAVRSRRRSLSARTQQVLEYVNSTSYLGYIAPARHSGTRAAIDRYRELIAAAAQEGLSVPSPLGVEDCFPGSVGKYWNPYHYPLRSWAESKRPVGDPLETV
ncbi:MAG: ATP-binding protein [Terriglobales bacterium]